MLLEIKSNTHTISKKDSQTKSEYYKQLAQVEQREKYIETNTYIYGLLNSLLKLLNGVDDDDRSIYRLPLTTARGDVKSYISRNFNPKYSQIDF